MKTLSDLFEEHIGAKEWDSYVTRIITWFYGYMAKVAWCAISMSYMAHQLGIDDQTGKNQNCYYLLEGIKTRHKKTGKGVLKLRGETLKKGDVIKRGTIIFCLYDDPPMKPGSHKHVTTAYKDFTYKGTGTFQALGGNQSDMICVKANNQSNIWATFYPDYEDDKVLKKGDTGPAVTELQKDLNLLGYRDDADNKLKIDGSFGGKTEQAVKNFQKDQKLTVDGHFGPKSRIKLDVLLKKVKTIKTLAILKVRKYPTADSEKCYHNIPKGKTYTASRWKDGYVYLPDLGGWVTEKYTE